MEISVLQWNVWYNEDLQKIADFLVQHPADILCLQELTIGHVPYADKTPEYLAEKLGYHCYYKEIPIETTAGKGITLASAILSKFPISASRFVWINEPRSGGGYSDEYRAYVEVTLEINDQKVTLATTHLSYTDRFQPTAQKAKETANLVALLRQHTQNFIFTGDLNAPPDSPTIQAISEHLQNAGPEITQKTWTTKPFDYNGFHEKDLNWRLDYVFATPDLRVTNAQIISTTTSDHLPILAKFTLSQAHTPQLSQ